MATAISAEGGRQRNHTECDDVELIVVDDESTDEPTRVQERNNLARILAVKVHDDGTRAIPQAIFADDDLVIKVRPRQETFKRLRNESLMISCDHHYSELHPSPLPGTEFRALCKPVAPGQLPHSTAA